MSEGVDVVLPWKTWIPPPEKATVEWSRHEPWPMIVHVYQSGSNCLEKQTWLYRGRTKMEDEDPRKNRNLSLVLRKPTVLDSGEYTCTIKEEERVVRAKCLRLHVRGQRRSLFPVSVVFVSSCCLTICLLLLQISITSLMMKKMEKRLL